MLGNGGSENSREKWNSIPAAAALEEEISMRPIETKAKEWERMGEPTHQWDRDREKVSNWGRYQRNSHSTTPPQTDTQWDDQKRERKRELKQERGSCSPTGYKSVQLQWSTMRGPVRERECSHTKHRHKTEPKLVKKENAASFQLF